MEDSVYRSGAAVLPVLLALVAAIGASRWRRRSGKTSLRHPWLAGVLAALALAVGLYLVLYR